MKIIFLEAVQNHGGARMSTLELAKRMQEIGHEILIVDFWGVDLEFNKRVQEYGLKYKIIEKRNFPFIINNRSKIHKLKNTINYFILQNRYRHKFKKITDLFSPDIVCVNNLKCLNILERKASYKIDYFVRTWLFSKNIKLTTRFFLKKYNPRFLTVSQACRQAIYTAGLANFEDIKVLHSVMDDKIYYDYKPSYKNFDLKNPIKILHSGGFLHTKGQHVMLEIAIELKKRLIPFQMILTGVIYTGANSDRYYKEIINLINKSNLNDSIDVVINPPNILDFFKNTDILIHPSYTEGLPRVTLEALSFGKPVIANPVGGVIDVIIHNHTGFLTDFNNIEQYVKYIEKYFDLNLYISHSDNARKLISQNYLNINQKLLIQEIYPIS